MEKEGTKISGVGGDVIGVGVDGNGNIIAKNINIVIKEVKEEYGLILLHRDHFKKYKSTENDFMHWKNGFSFGLESIYEKKALRQNVVDVIEDELEKNRRLLLLGESGSSKSTILLEVMCEYFDKGYQILYNLGDPDLKNDDSLINFLENMADADNKVLVVVDNVHEKKTSAIFYLMERIESYEKKENFLFLLGARQPEYSLLEGVRLSEIEQEKHRDSIRKFRDDSSLKFKIPPFTIEEIKEFIRKYADIRPIEEAKESIEEILNKKAIDIYDKTKGNPIMVKFAVFSKGLHVDVEDRFLNYMHDPRSKLVDPFKFQTAIVCSLLDIAGVQINDRLLESMKLKQYARTLRGAILYYNHRDGTWKTIHPRWDIELLSFLYGEKSAEDESAEDESAEDVARDVLEERKSYLEDSIKTIFSIGDEKISVSVIQILYDITAAVTSNGSNKISIDLIEKVIQIPDYVSNHTQSQLYSSTIASNYFKLKRYDDALEKCQKAIELDPNYANGWYNRGIVLYNLEKYEEAIVSLSKAIELNPNDAYSWYNMGNVYGSQANHHQAIECYDKATRLDPKYKVAWRNKGISNFILKRYQYAVECYDKALELDPSDKSIRNAKSVALEYV